MKTLKPAKTLLALSALAALTLPVWAECPYDAGQTGAMTPCEWKSMEKDAQALVEKADKLTSAAHNPRVKDFYEAGALYAQAATLYETGSVRMSTLIKEKPDWAAKQTEIEKMAKTLSFKSFQATNAGSNRETRGLL